MIWVTLAIPVGSKRKQPVSLARTAGRGSVSVTTRCQVQYIAPSSVCTEIMAESESLVCGQDDVSSEINGNGNCVTCKYV